MKVKTADLIGPALDWAVAEAEGLRPFIRPRGVEVLFSGLPQRVPFFPSTNWAQGGPIIDGHKISLAYALCCGNTGQKWEAVSVDDLRLGGHTPLVAAMRCYVASKLGDEIDIPEELT